MSLWRVLYRGLLQTVTTCCVRSLLCCVRGVDTQVRTCVAILDQDKCSAQEELLLGPSESNGTLLLEVENEMNVRSKVKYFNEGERGGVELRLTLMDYLDDGSREE